MALIRMRKLPLLMERQFITGDLEPRGKIPVRFLITDTYFNKLYTWPHVSSVCTIKPSA